jgi:RNA ligase (TIGR02306 family)
VDSFLPIREEYEFLRKSSYKKMADGTEGFRLKTIKLRGQISQGLILPLSVLEGEDEMKIGVSSQPHGDQLQLGPYDDALVIEEGIDVTEVLGIVKYEPPVPAQLSGQVKGMFPSFLKKTDEDRIQNLTKEFERFKTQTFYVTEKLDGSSVTYYVRDGEFGVCYRNLDLERSETNSMWKYAIQNGIEEKMKSLGRNIAFQGEIIGEGIQGNPYKVIGQKVYFFNVFDIDKYHNVDLYDFIEILGKLELQHVPIVEFDFQLPETIDEVLEYADGKSVLNKNTIREGVVIRTDDMDVSFKAISNQFLLVEG